MIGWKGATVGLALAVFTGVDSCSANSPVTTTVQITRSGCALNASGSTHLSFWHAKNYPGNGDAVKIMDTVADDLRIELTPGYYRVMLSTGGCWEEDHEFSLLPGRSRVVKLDFKSFSAAPGSDYSVYSLPQGAIAGLIPAAVDRVQVVRSLAGASPESTVDMQGGAYYADNLSPGTFKISAYIGSAKADATATVTNDTITRVDFTPGEFRNP